MAKMVDTQAADDMMHGMFRAQAKMMDAVLKQNIETLEFLRQRFEKDGAMFASLSDARDSAAAGAVLTDFWQRAFSDYSAEAGRLGAMMTATVEQMQQGLTEEARAMMGGAEAAKTGKS